MNHIPPSDLKVGGGNFVPVIGFCEFMSNKRCCVDLLQGGDADDDQGDAGETGA